MAKSKKDVGLERPQAEIPAPQDEETLEISVVREGVPTYMISADTGFGMLAMLALNRLVTEWSAPEELRREIERKMREFELYEEAHRGDAHT